MEVIVLDKAIKELSKISKPQARKILDAIENLSKYPDIQNIKKLKNHTPTHRLRVGDYRVLFDIEEDKIIVGRVRHRKKAYS